MDTIFFKKGKKEKKIRMVALKPDALGPGNNFKKCVLGPKIVLKITIFPTRVLDL